MHIMGKETKMCKHCKTEIPKGAKVCPQCRKKQGGKLKWIIIVFVVFGFIGVATSGGSDANKVDSPGTTEENTPTVKPEESKEEVEVEANTTDAPTVEESNALGMAKTYLGTMAFSYSGLIRQLEYEGYSAESATYAVDNCGADWNEQAALAAENYLNTMAFSRSGLIEQLKYEGYTDEQAEYGASAVGY